ncbi:peptidase M48, Ste24p [Pseudomonas nitroreducens]|jgi:hypothetical protein|uniref:peptidase M48, Ste24p n=1 Tax=Pseudomonas nitroreducens TaxID=46680 RepID=UPI00244774A2|nr:peptidase M48, Ste24p [Pseudomonas nitroreducens]MDG9858198.1 peptidase M48, Ste24p [Pseudomonas nitroreducens]
MEPTSTAAGALLAKYGVYLASFLGAVCSLGFLKNLSRGQAAFAVIVGFCSSTYWSWPLSIWIGKHFDLPVDSLVGGIAFAIGLTAMNIVPGLKLLAGRVATWGAPQ